MTLFMGYICDVFVFMGVRPFYGPVRHLILVGAVHPYDHKANILT